MCGVRKVSKQLHAHPTLKTRLGRGGQALSHRDFRFLFAAQTISAVGDAAYGVVLSWFTYQFTGSSAAVGLVLGGTALTTLISLLAGGVLADRWDRRALMILSDASRCVLVATLAVLIFTDALTLPLLILLTAAAGLVDGLFSPSLSGMIPRLVPSFDLTSANGLIGFTRASSAIGGAALGGAMYAALGAGPVMLLNAGSFALSAVLVARIPRTGKEARKPNRQGAAKDLLEGLTYVFKVPVLISIPVAAAALMIADAPTSVLMPAVVDVHFNGTAATVGWLAAAYGIGTAIGSLITAVTGGGRRPAVIIFGSWALAHLAAAVMVAQPLTTLAIILAGVRGLLGGAGGTLWNDLLMRNVPQDKLSRVFSIDTFGVSALTPIGIGATSLFLTQTGPVPVIVIGQAAAFTLMASLLLRRQIRNA
jgi:MFS family permease